MEHVNHPDHYNIPGRKECIVEIQEKYGVRIAVIFCLTNAYKYLYRAGEKPGNSKMRDIEKAKWYLAWADAHKSIITGRSFIKLYQDIRKELKRYDQG